MPSQPRLKMPWSDEELPPAQPGRTDLGMLEPSYHEPYLAWTQNKSPQTASRLLAAVNPVIDEAVRSYAGGESGTATAKANAKRLALEAFDRYDPARAKLKTHLLSHLRGLRRVTQRSISGIYVPEQWKIDSQRIGSVIPDLTDKLGRVPSDAEIADHLGFGVDRVRKARAVPGVLASGQVGDVMTSGRGDPKAFAQWTEAVYHDLGPVDQVILENSFGMHGKPVLPAHEIATMVNLSPGAISQRKARIQQMLDEFDMFLGRASR